MKNPLSTTMRDVPKLGGLNGNEPAPIPGAKTRDASAGSIPLRTKIEYPMSPEVFDTPMGTGIKGIGKP